MIDINLIVKKFGFDRENSLANFRLIDFSAELDQTALENKRSRLYNKNENSHIQLAIQ